MNELRLKWRNQADSENLFATFAHFRLVLECHNISSGGRDFVWFLCDAVGDVIAESEVYESQQSAQLAVEDELQQRLKLCAETLDSSWLEAEPEGGCLDSLRGRQLDGYMIDESEFTSGPTLFCNPTDWAFLTKDYVPKFDIIATDPAYQEQADQAAKVVNHLVEEEKPIRCAVGHWLRIEYWGKDCPVCKASLVGQTDTQEELPGLRENVERLIEEQLARQRPLAGQAGTQYLICKECDLWSNTPDVYSCSCGFAASRAAGAPTGYDQILAQIKREASEVEL